MKRRREGEGSEMKFERNFILLMVVATLSVPGTAHAIFGVGDEVFDPTMYASQLQQLQQETATVTNLAQQLQYAIKNTTGGGAGGWQSNQNLLTNLGGLISEQQGLSYTFQGLSQQFQQLYAGYNAGRAKPTGKRRYHVQHPKRRAAERAVAGPEFSE
jgi:P-type conjugative transfer protein TrbJ